MSFEFQGVQKHNTTIEYSVLGRRRRRDFMRGSMYLTTTKMSSISRLLFIVPEMKCDVFRPLGSTSLQNLSSNGVLENNMASNLSTISSGSVLSLASNGSGGSSARKKKIAAPLPPVLMKSKVSAQEAAIPVRI